MVESKPPYDASVDNIRDLCEELRDASEEESADLEEKLDNLNGSTFDRNLDAAVILGLFEKNEDELYSPTTRGKRLGYELSDEEEVDLFRKIIRENEFYSRLLEVAGDELIEKDDEQYLSRDDVQSEIGINFDFGVSDRTLESAARTFLGVMDAAGVGTYKQGRGKYPTRLVVNDEYSGFLSEVVEESGTDNEKMEKSEQIEIPLDDSEQSTQKEDDAENHNEDIVVKQRTEGLLKYRLI